MGRERERGRCLVKSRRPLYFLICFPLPCESSSFGFMLAIFAEPRAGVEEGKEDRAGCLGRGGTKPEAMSAGPGDTKSCNVTKTQTLHDMLTLTPLSQPQLLGKYGSPMCRVWECLGNQRVT